MKTVELERKGKIILYRTKDRKTLVEVRLEGETVWLNLSQMAVLFDRDKSVISRHLKQVYRSRELEKKTTVAKTATVQIEGKRKIRRQVDYYNLDAIISVGYRVNSKRGTQFRIWATRTLKEHLIQGFTLSKRRLKEREVDFEQALQLLSRTLKRQALVSEQGKAVLDVISNYAKTWRLLLQYDEERLKTPEKASPVRFTLDYPAAQEAITLLKEKLLSINEANDLFGRERENSLHAILGAIEQTFDGKPLYPGIEERASHLLYFVIKDPPFTDGNKRIGSFLFILFLRENGFLVDSKGQFKLNENALVALALLIAESDSRNKELMIRLIMNLLTENVG
jgi:prophage maintenance system killer protein